MSSVLQSAWARLLFGSLVKAGLCDIVISPGSRSTPFTWAALNTPGLRCHSVPDERSAGFFALGQARVSGKASAVLCTSGSAAAHYFPAIVEAAQAFVPLLVLSADRPFELMDCGAAQVMDQSKLYGGFVRHYAELGHPDASDVALDALPRIVAQALALTLAPAPGPVHLNARARKPLEPQLASSDADRAIERAVEQRLARPLTQVLRTLSSPAPAALETLASACRSAKSGLIVCGPLPASAESPAKVLLELSRQTGFALCAETTSQVRTLIEPNAELGVIGSFEAALSLAPELIIQIGIPPTSALYERWLAANAPRRAVVSAHGWLDPNNRAEWLIAADPEAFASALVRALPRTEEPELASARHRHREELLQRDARYWQFVDEVIAEAAPAPLSEARAVQIALGALPEAALLGLGNSLPIRDVDAFVRPSQQRFRVWSQRGVNGIDGLVAGAAGAAQAVAQPSLLLLGDVSLLHDLGSLYVARSAQAPLVICMLDNAGGRIFEELPIQAALSARPELARFWLTPPDLDWSKAAAAFGVAYSRAEDETALANALREAFARPGCSVVHAVVAPDSARSARQKVRTRFATLFAS